jgi:hypothetical protein
LDPFLSSDCVPAFGLPEEPVPENLFLIFYPTPEGLERKTIANSASKSGRTLRPKRDVEKDERRDMEKWGRRRRKEEEEEGKRNRESS